MLFVHPNAFWLLVLLVPLIGLYVKNRSGLTRSRAGAAALLRALAMGLLVCALARPVLQRPELQKTTVFAVDISESLSDADLATIQAEIEKHEKTPTGEQTRLVVFDRQATQVQLPAEQLSRIRAARMGTVSSSQPAGSAIADALELAGTLIPHDAGGRVLLFSDGLETSGDALTAACRLFQRQIPVQMTLVGARRAREVVLRHVDCRPVAGIGETIQLQAEVEASQQAPAQLVVRDLISGHETRSEHVLRDGSQVLTCPLTLSDRGLRRYEVQIQSEVDTRPDNNRLPIAVEVLAPLNVRVAEHAGAASARAALAALLGNSAEVTSLDLAQADLAGSLTATDVLVVADQPAETIPASAQNAIRDAVTRGMGLLACGGRRAFGPGGYANTPLAEALPVRFSQEVERRDPSTTLVVIIDTSGSMTGPRVTLAKEIARLAIGRLKPHDKCGIVEFYGSKRWAAPIQPASNAIDLQRALNRLSASGGTVILPAIEESYYALQNVSTRTKHVLVLTDGGVESGAFEPLIRKMADHHITLSTVMVGPGAHSTFLASLAHWGRGHFYAAPDRFSIPEVIVKQPENSLLSPFVEQVVSLTQGERDPVLDGVDLTAAPGLHGYAETLLRPSADRLIMSSLGHPVLARWRYGLGGAAAWTSQLGGEWSAEFMQWPQAARMFSDLVRSLPGPRAGKGLRVQPVARPGAMEIQIDSAWPEDAHADDPVELRAEDLAGRRQTWTLDPFQPHRWNLRLDNPRPEVYRLSARTSGGQLNGVAAVAVPESREISSIGPDEQFKQRLGEMKDRLPATARGNMLLKRGFELWPAFVISSMLLMLVGLLVRRWPVRLPRVAGVAAVAVWLCVMSWARPSWGATSSAPASRAATSATKPAPQALVPLEKALKAADVGEAQQLLDEASRLQIKASGSLDPVVACLADRQNESVRAAWLLYQALRSRGDLAQAQQVLGSLTERQPQDAAVWAELARIRELLGDDKAALEAIRKAQACRPSPEQATALSLRAAPLLRDAGDVAGCTAEFEAVARQQGATSSIGHYVAHLAALLGDNVQAEKTLQAEGGDKEKFHDHLFRGLLLLRLDQAERARQEFESAYSLAPLERDRRFALERIIAAARRDNGLDRLAAQWLADENLSPDRLNALACVLRELGRSADALNLLNRPARTPAQQKLIESADFQRELVAAALASGQVDDAERAYLKLLESHPRQVEWRVSLARLRLLNGHRDEAKELFREALKWNDLGLLMPLAEGARSLALDDIALLLARQAATAGLAQQIRAGLFEADLVRQRGDADKALALARNLVTPAGQDPKLLQLVAETLERYGDSAEALRLFKKLYQDTQTEDTLLLVAYLLEKNEQLEEAFGLWKKMWETTGVPARQRQAQERMLDLAARTSKLGELAIEIEERVEAGKASDRELSLLVDIYTAANDGISAAETLYDFASRGGREIETLKRLARVYLSCEQFGRCNATLRRLAELDPANASDYLQQIAIVALERKQPQDARKALAELAALNGSDETVDEFAAGVMDMTGLHAEAARAYERVIASHPDRIESLLLWGNAMKAAEQVDQAIGRFQVIVEDAEEDDLFTVAIDGLLNLDAKPAALRSALRRVYSRIAAHPEKVFLYQLAGDLLEALGQSEQMRSVLEQAVIVAGERRGPLLRELMDGARADNKAQKQIEYGRSLLALNDEIPPQVFLELGEALIGENDLAMAERVFERASVDGDFSAIQQRVAGYYEDASRPGDADRVIRELLISEPDNVSLLIRSGSLGEQLGNYNDAFAQYYRAADLMLRRVPGAVRTEATSRPAPKTQADQSVTRTSRSGNLDEISQYFEAAENGLLNAARTLEQQEKLKRSLQGRVDEELRSLTGSRTLMPVLSRNPRLEKLVRLLRQAAFSLHDPELADAVDRKLLVLYPQDRSLRSDIVQCRLDWGLYNRADHMRAEPGSQPASAPRTKATASRQPKATQPTDSGPSNETSVAESCRALPGLIMKGQTQQAKLQLQQLQLPPEAVPAVAPRLISAAASLDEPDAVLRWIELTCEGLVKARPERVSKTRQGGRTVETLEKCIRVGWSSLGKPQRLALVERVGRVAAGMAEEERVPLQLLQLKLADAVGVPIEGIDDMARAAADNSATSSETLALLLDRLAPDRRADMLRAIMAARRGPAQRQTLLEIAGRLTSPMDASFVALFVELFKKAPASKLDARAGYYQLTRAGWHRNAAQPELAVALAETLLSETPDSSPVLAATAVARNLAGRHDPAFALAREVLDRLLAAGQLEMDSKGMLDYALGVMTPSELEKLAAEIVEQQEVEPPSPPAVFIKGLVLEAAGRRNDAIAAYKAAYAAVPSNRTFSRKLISALRDDNRLVDLTGLLAASLTKSTLMESFEWRTLAQSYYALWALPAASKAAQKDETPLSPLEQMRTARLMGRNDKVHTIFRRFMIRNRDSGRFYTPFWPPEPSAGGLIGFLDAQRMPLFKAPRLFEALADMPFAEEDYAAMLLAARPERKDISGLVTGLLKATRLKGDREKLLASLLAAQKVDGMTVKDQAVLLAFAAEDPAAVPANLLASMEVILANLDPAAAEQILAVARVYEATGRKETAAGLLNWLLISDLESGNGGDPQRRFEHLDRYLACLPESERAASRNQWILRFGPTPLDPLTGEYEIAWLEYGQADAAAMEAAVASLRKRVAGDGSAAFNRDLAAVLARCDAAAGRLDSFRAQVTASFRRTDYGEGLSRQFDPRSLLPSADRMKQPGEYVDSVVNEIVSRRSAGALPNSVQVRLLSLVADWCRENKLTDKAGAILSRCVESAGEPGEHWLWIADVYRRMGDGSKAAELELRLLESDMLPVQRVPNLLQVVESTRGAAAADAVAVRVARYSDLPVALQRAMRVAEKNGDQAAAGRLRQRLQEVSPASAPAS